MKFRIAALIGMMLLAAWPAHSNDIAASTWSETAASNTAAPPNGWPSGTVTPVQVSPMMREMMAAIKRFYNHVNSTVTSGGSANAQTLTYSVAPAAYVTGDSYAFIVGVTNTGATTLNVNGLGAKDIKIGTSALTAGQLTAARVVAVYYDGTQFQLPVHSVSAADITGVIACTDLTNDGTACTANTGTSGATLPFLNGANTWSGVQSFDAGKLVLNSSGGSGQIVKQESAGGAVTVGTIACGGLSDDGTACTANTGTSGTALPFLDGTNTWSGAQTFGPVYGSLGNSGSVVSGTTYTFVAADCGKTTVFTSNSAVTATIPASIVPASTVCAMAVLQAGTAKVSVDGTAVAAATLISESGFTGTSGTAGSMIGLTLATISAATRAYLTGSGS